MAWAICLYRKGQIDNAGNKLITLDAGHPERDEALEVINNWRSCHVYPLHIVAKTLQERARSKVHRKAVVARRTKRLQSIALKLRHNPAMKLSQMQDIGGCRAVMTSVTEAERLVAVYEEARAKHPDASDRASLYKIYDYIQSPKLDGYRGMHLIMKYQSNTKTEYNGQRIEIQIRSRLQHAWATAVETCQAFTGQALKAKVKTGSAEWLRFFSLMSSAIAFREKRPIVPGTPTTKLERRDEIKSLVNSQSIISLLGSWNHAMKHPIIAEDHVSAAYLLELNVNTKQLTVSTYKKEEMPDAHFHYLAREKATESNPDIQVVLVSAESLLNIKRAYPNFYVDTTAFIQAIQQEIY